MSVSRPRSAFDDRRTGRAEDVPLDDVVDLLGVDRSSDCGPIGRGRRARHRHASAGTSTRTRWRPRARGTRRTGRPPARSMIHRCLRSRASTVSSGEQQPRGQRPRSNCNPIDSSDVDAPRTPRRPACQIGTSPAAAARAPQGRLRAGRRRATRRLSSRVPLVRIGLAAVGSSPGSSRRAPLPAGGRWCGWRCRAAGRTGACRRRRGPASRG